MASSAIDEDSVKVSSSSCRFFVRLFRCSLQFMPARRSLYLEISRFYLCLGDKPGVTNCWPGRWSGLSSHRISKFSTSCQFPWGFRKIYCHYKRWKIDFLWPFRQCQFLMHNQWVLCISDSFAITLSGLNDTSHFLELGLPRIFDKLRAIRHFISQKHNWIHS